MASTTTSEIEHICFRINPCLLETCCKISLFSSCFGWINYFREQQWSTYNLPGAVLTTRDAEVNRPSMGLLAVQETDRGKVYCWWELPWGYRKESPILNAKGFTPPPHVWVESWRTRTLYFCCRLGGWGREVFQRGGNGIRKSTELWWWLDKSRNPEMHSHWWVVSGRNLPTSVPHKVLSLSIPGPWVGSSFTSVCHMRNLGSIGLGTWRKDHGPWSGRLGWVWIVKGWSVGLARRSLASSVRCLGMVLPWQTTVEGEDMGPQVASRLMQLASYSAIVTIPHFVFFPQK